MCLIVCSLILLNNLTPLNLALTLTIASIVVRITAYSLSLSVFPSAIVLISFSSGTIIVFCYCAIITNYIQKSTKRVILNIILLSSLPMVITIRKLSREVDNTNLTKNISSSIVICVAIRVVILRIMCINKSMYKKEKPLKLSY